jgi:hypothetical protein
MISSVTSEALSWRSRKTSGNFLAARIRTPTGVVTITAPIVPPSTIMAAVIWGDVP